MRTLIVGLFALVVSFGLTAQAQADIVVHDTVGWPNPNPAWTDGGNQMSIRYNTGPGNTWIATGQQISITHPTEINYWAGAMWGNGLLNNWNSVHLEINVSSSPVQFGLAGGLSGDVFGITNGVSFANLSGGNPPQFGGLTAQGRQIHLVELAFEPFVLQPGDYVINLQGYVLGADFGWVETTEWFGVPSDLRTNGAMMPDFVELRGMLGNNTGNAAMVIRGTVIPAPGVGVCFALAGLATRRRNRCRTTTAVRPCGHFQAKC